MSRLAFLVLLALATAAPAAAQVINGETPLDETSIDRGGQGAAGQPGASAPPPPVAPDADGETPRRDLPQTAPRRD